MKIDDIKFIQMCVGNEIIDELIFFYNNEDVYNLYINLVENNSKDDLNEYDFFIEHDAEVSVAILGHPDGFGKLIGEVYTEYLEK